MSATPSATRLHLELRPTAPPLLHVEPPGDVPGWAVGHRDELRAAVREHGSLVVRGLGLREPDQVAQVFGAIADTLMVEREAFAPRSSYADAVYSSTTWPANQQMCMHHELSYRTEVPGLMLFACLRAPASGGATAVADSAAVLDALPTELVDRFEREGWLLTRTYGEDIGASLSEAFGTDDRDAIDRYCREHDIECEWRPDGELRTRQRRPAVLRHPASGRRCWFNQVAFLNEWTLDPEVREFLVDMYGADALPFNTRFGGGDPVTADVVELLNQAAEAYTVREPWQAGDLMLVDNLRTAHSREPYQGDREVLVAMADPVRPADLAGREVTR